MKNKSTDLRNHMFAALERLNNEDLTPEQLKSEIERAKAVSEVGKVIVESAKTEVLFHKLTNKQGKPEFLDDEEDNVKKIERPKAEYSNKSPLGIASGN